MNINKNFFEYNLCNVFLKHGFLRVTGKLGTTYQSKTFSTIFYLVNNEILIFNNISNIQRLLKDITKEYEKTKYKYENRLPNIYNKTDKRERKK